MNSATRKTDMPDPTVTDLQFRVLSILTGQERTGREIRRLLEQQGQKKSLAAFYQLMGRLEDANMVEGWYEPKMIDGVAVKESVYRVTGHGIRARERKRDFYAEAAMLAGPQLRPEGA
jgi:DNA-binding PadR family transcriptional regulator